MPEPSTHEREVLPNGPGAMGRGGPRVLPPETNAVSSVFGPQLWDRMDLDPVLYAATARLATAALVGGVHVLPAFEPRIGQGPDARARKAAKIADFIRGMFETLERPLSDVAYEMMREAWKFGNKLAEPVEYDTLINGKRMMRDLSPKPHWSWRVQVNDRGRATGIVPSEYRANVNAAYPIDDFVLLTWDARDGDIRGRSMYQHVYRPWNYKTQALPEHFAYVGRFASPSVSVEIAESLAGTVVPVLDAAGNPTSEPDIPIETACYRSGIAWKNGYLLVLPAGCKPTVHEAIGNGEAFLKGFEYYDNQMTHGVHHTARAVMATNKNSQADAGAAKDTEDDLIVWLGEWVAGVFAKLAKRYVAINFGEDAARDFAPLVLVGEMATHDVAKEMAVATTAGFALHKSQFEALDQRYGLPERAEGWDQEQPLPLPLAGAAQTGDWVAQTETAPPPVDAKPADKGAEKKRPAKKG